MRALSDTTALILAGGLGARLRSAVPDRQKVMAPVGGRPFLAFLLDQLAAAGLRRVVLCVGYHSDQVQSELGLAYGPLTLEYSVESEPLGTGGALRLAAEKDLPDQVLVLNGDSFVQAELQPFWAAHLEHQARASLLLVAQTDTSAYGRVQLDAASQITAFEEKGAGGPGWINAGRYAMRLAAMRAIPAGRPVSLEREVFPQWIQHGLYGHLASGAFLDIGTPQRYAAARPLISGDET